MDISGIFKPAFGIVKVMSKYFENKLTDEQVAGANLSGLKAIHLQEIDVL